MDGIPSGFKDQSEITLSSCSIPWAVEERSDGTETRRRTRGEIRARKSPASCFHRRRGVTLATSYFRTTYRSTIIGAKAFHFRVRNGNGWGHFAGITRSLIPRLGLVSFGERRLELGFRLLMTTGIKHRRFAGGQASFLLISFGKERAGSLTSAYRD